MHAQTRSSLPSLSPSAISVRSQGFALTQALRDYALRRAQAALQIATHELRGIAVQLSDTNGPRGGNDKRCALHISLGQGRTLRVVDVQSDMYAAIDCAFDRCKQSLARRLRKAREKPVQLAPWLADPARHMSLN
jgi:putative sigma-54 modulation protein